MTATEPAPAASVALASSLTLGDLREALLAGWADFEAHPSFGIFFAAVFTMSGLGLTYPMVSLGEVSWPIPAAAGFPIIGLFVAVGLYEVSRQRELGLPSGLPQSFGAAAHAGLVRSGDLVGCLGMRIQRRPLHLCVIPCSSQIWNTAADA